MKPLLVSLIFVALGFCADKPATPTAPVIPSALAIDNPRSVVVTERSVVPIHVCQLQDTILALPEKELSRSAHVADGDNWIIRTAGGNQASRFLDIKVRMPLTTETTLNVITDHDSTYTFLLVLGSGHCDSKVFIDADEQLTKHIAETRPWASPEEVDRMKAEIDQANKSKLAEANKAETQVEAFRSTYPAKLRFDYKFDQKTAEKMGIHEIFHDGKFTYVSASPQETPALFEVKQGKPSEIQFDFKDGLYSTARIIDQGYLAVGGNGNGKHQEKLEFKRVAGEEN